MKFRRKAFDVEAVEIRKLFLDEWPKWFRAAFNSGTVETRTPGDFGRTPWIVVNITNDGGERGEVDEWLVMEADGVMSVMSAERFVAQYEAETGPTFVHNLAAARANRQNDSSLMSPAESLAEAARELAAGEIKATGSIMLFVDSGNDGNDFSVEYRVAGLRRSEATLLLETVKQTVVGALLSGG